MKATLIIFLLLGFSHTAAAEEPLTCQCPSLTTKEQTEQATYVFNADIWAVEMDGSAKQRVITVDVNDTFKGKPKMRLEVRDNEEANPCATDFHEGESYLFFVKWQWGSMLTSRCWGTKRVQEVGGEAWKLGPGAAAKEKFYAYLRERCMGRLDTLCCLSSIKVMRQHGYMPQPESGCPDDLVPDRLRCDGSYMWCAPATELRRDPKN